MSVENEDRNCCSNNNMMVANTSNYLSSDLNMNEMQTCCSKQIEQREAMLEQIKCYGFAIRDIALYLDTHPDDEKALCLHNKYCREYKEITDKYQKVYGPLTIYFPCNKWRWVEEPWATFCLGVSIGGRGKKLVLN